jgi:hypothetical protein
VSNTIIAKKRAQFGIRTELPLICDLEERVRGKEAHFKNRRYEKLRIPLTRVAPQGKSHRAEAKFVPWTTFNLSRTNLVFL